MTTQHQTTPHFGPSATTSTFVIWAIRVLLPTQVGTNVLWLYSDREVYQYMYLAVCIVMIVLCFGYYGMVYQGHRQEKAWLRRKMELENGNLDAVKGGMYRDEEGGEAVDEKGT
jgi:hypothetical protein